MASLQAARERLVTSLSKRTTIGAPIGTSVLSTARESRSPAGATSASSGNEPSGAAVTQTGAPAPGSPDGAETFWSRTAAPGGTAPRAPVNVTRTFSPEKVVTASMPGATSDSAPPRTAGEARKR
jgi:hypothetical protein